MVHALARADAGDRVAADAADEAREETWVDDTPDDPPMRRTFEYVEALLAITRRDVAVLRAAGLQAGLRAG